MPVTRVVSLIAVATLVVFAYTQLPFFVMQPIGALPDGRTMLVWRTSRLHFIGSADGVCARENGGVSLLCRGVILGAVVENNPIIMRLPYSSFLYSLSTDGATYDR
jgi:hypothetical protein